MQESKYHTSFSQSTLAQIGKKSPITILEGTSVGTHIIEENLLPSLEDIQSSDQ